MLPEPQGLRLSAVFDEAQRHRYQMRAEWEGGRGVVMFCMLNPGSAVPAKLDDPTVKKDIGYARRWGYAATVLGNLFTFRTPDPDELRRNKVDPNGPEADEWLRRIAGDPSVEIVVAAWGQHAPQWRVTEVLTLLAEVGHRRLFCLGTTKGGHPCHPGRIAYSTPLEPWTPNL